MFKVFIKKKFFEIFYRKKGVFNKIIIIQKSNYINLNYINLMSIKLIKYLLK